MLIGRHFAGLDHPLRVADGGKNVGDCVAIGVTGIEDLGGQQREQTVAKRRLPGIEVGDELEDPAGRVMAD